MDQIKKLAPPGIPIFDELRLYLCGIVISFLISLGYFIRLFAARSEMYVYSTVHGKILNPDFVMPAFSSLVSGVFVGFLFVAFASLFVSVYHYSYYSSCKSHTLYLIKRLPTRGYLAMTCLSLPVLMAAISLLIALILLTIYYGIYVIATPEELFGTGQLASLWS